MFQHAKAGYQWAGSAVGTQRHIDPESKTVFPDFGQGSDEFFAEPTEKFMVGQTFLIRTGQRFAVLRIDKNQINIGGDIELPATELAHTQHDKLLRFTGTPGDRYAKLGLEFGGQGGLGGLYRKVGKIAHGGDDIVEIGTSGQIFLNQGANQ